MLKISEELKTCVSQLDQLHFDLRMRRNTISLEEFDKYMLIFKKLNTQLKDCLKIDYTPSM